MNNKYCPQCGRENTNDNSFCIGCGYKFNQDSSNEQNIVVVDQNDSTATMLGVISLVLYFGGSVIFALISYFLPEELRSIISSIGGVCPLAGIVVMIVGRVKYPQNKFLEIVMWIIIGMMILGLVLSILFVVACLIACSTMDTSGCY